MEPVMLFVLAFIAIWWLRSAINTFRRDFATAILFFFLLHPLWHMWVFFEMFRSDL